MNRFKLGIFAIGLLLLAGPQALRSDDGPEHRVEQARPIQLGTSGGNINDISSLYCCAGTLGALVVDGDGQYILSNNHVLARSNQGRAGDPVIQPGMIDQQCEQDTLDTVAHLSRFAKLRFKKGKKTPLNQVDAAIAEVVAGTVDSAGAILDIGAVSSETLGAGVGLAVKKSGRTTGFTRGVVTAVDVTVDVGYSKSCGGAANQVARFTNQIIIGSANFSAGADSGSLIVEDVADQPRAVGLLFAGTSDGSITVANPIDAVLSALDVSLPGAAPPPPPPPPEPNAVGAVGGTVSDSRSGNAVAGATVSVDTGESAATDANGAYAIQDVPVGDRSVRASASGYRSKTVAATVAEGQQTTVNIALAKKGGGKKKKGQKGRTKTSSRKERVARAGKIKGRHKAKLHGVAGAVGSGVGLSRKGDVVIQVYLGKDSRKARRQAPASLEGVAVQLVVTGPIEAF